MNRLNFIPILILFLLVATASIPIVSPRSGSIYVNEFPFRQNIRADKMVVRDTSGVIEELHFTSRCPRDTIQKWLDSLTVGGKVYFQAGTYLIPDGDALQPKTGTRLIGVSNGEDHAEFRLTSTVGAQSIILLDDGQDNIQIENILFDGNISSGWGSANKYGVHLNSTSNPNEDITIKNCRFRKFTHPIRVSSGAQSTNLKVLYNDIAANAQEEAAVSFGVFIHDGSDTQYAIIEGNTIYGDNYVDGIGGADGQGIYLGGDNCTVRGNFIHDFKTSNDGGMGIYVLAGALYNTIQGNQLSRVNGDNISIRGDYTLCTDNYSLSSNDQGIVIEDANYAHVSGNYIRNAGTAGIRAINTINSSINNNHVDTAGQKAGIGDSYKALISLTNLPSTAPGGSSTEFLYQISVVGNHLSVTSGTTKYGILLDDTDEPTDITSQITLADNHIYPSRIDTCYAGAFFPDSVQTFRAGIPLYPFFLQSNGGNLSGLPDDTLDDSKSIQRWINEASSNGFQAIVPDGVFLVDVPCTLKNNISIEGRGGTFKAMPQRIDDWGQFRGMLEAENDTSIAIRGLTLDGNITAQDTTNATFHYRSIGVAMRNRVVSAIIENCTFLDWNHGVFFGDNGNSHAAKGIKDISIQNNRFRVQSRYKALVDSTGTTAVHAWVKGAADTLLGLQLNFNTAEDDSVKQLPDATGGTTYTIPWRIEGNVFASSIQKNYTRVLEPVSGSFFRTDSLYTDTSFELSP